MNTMFHSLTIAVVLTATINAHSQIPVAPAKSQPAQSTPSIGYADVMIKTLIELARHEETLKAQEKMVVAEVNKHALLTEVCASMSGNKELATMKNFLEAELVLSEAKIAELKSANKTLALNIKKLQEIGMHCSSKMESK